MTDPDNNVTELHTQRSVTGGGGNGNDLHGRVSAIEARLDYLATKEDIQRVEKLISDRESSLQRWLIGIVLTAMGTLAIALVKVFVD